MKKYGKFAVLVVVILGTLLWLGTVGSGESKTYYKTITEVRQMSANPGKKRVRVIGDVQKDSIQRRAGEEGIGGVPGLRNAVRVKEEHISRVQPRPPGLIRRVLEGAHEAAAPRQRLDGPAGRPDRCLSGVGDLGRFVERERLRDWRFPAAAGSG